ncbi:uncharacterized protein DNG_01805 [Cephalotrichum gorgonifer]|uniref:Clr5 domain-containing protein n=1 Tax=Cephalotrichum gorgonifer TaxID=2041049 RepID=A0AAE8MS92_9PEZI|nr:uncharacterized protein DNG_01805 [Cephalotrichum gorgonifer]
MFNHSPDKVRGGLGSRHVEDQPLGGTGHGLGIGITSPQHHQQYSQPQAHNPHQQPLFPSDFGFESSSHQSSSMSGFSASMGHGEARFQTHGEEDMNMDDVNPPEPRVTNLIAHFENRSTKPNKPTHNVPGSAPTAFGRATNQFRVSSPTAEQFTSSLRVRSGSIGRPPPARFGSMGQQGHSALRVASPMAVQAGDAHVNTSTATPGSHVADAPMSPFRTIPGAMDMPRPLRRQASNVGGGMRPGRAGNVSSSLYSNIDTLSPSTGHFEGPSSPFGFVNNPNRAARPMHMMDSFGGSAASPIIGTPTSPFGSMDFSAPRVLSPVQSPSADPYGDLVHFGTSMGDNPPLTPFDHMSPGGGVTSPMQPQSGVDTYASLGMDGKEASSFVGSPTDHFQGLDPFNSMNSLANQHSTHSQFAHMSAAASIDTWGDLSVFVKQEPSADTAQFNSISPAPRSSVVDTPMDFAGQGYFSSHAHQQPPQLQPEYQQHQHQQHQSQPHQSHQPQLQQRRAHGQPPARPAKKAFLRQQNTAGSTSTPGFNIWKPPVPTTPKPVISHTHQQSSSISSTPNASFLPHSQSGLRIQTDRAPSPQPPNTDMSITSPDIMPSSVASPIQGTLSAASPNPPPLPVRPQQGARPSREQVPVEAWEAVKPTIRHLYLEERKPLKEVIRVMAENHGFQATPKMYKTRFSQWGFVKNNTEEEVKKLLSMKFQRDARGKVTEFVRNGRVINLGTYLKRKGVTEYDLVDFETPADLPAYVRCRTPTPPPVPGYLRSPDLLRAQEAVVGNIRKAFLHCRQSELDTKSTVGWSTIMLWGAGSSELLYGASRRMEAGGAGEEVDLIGAFKQLEVDLAKLSPQGISEVLLAMVRRDPGMTTALSKYLAAYATTNFDRAHPLRQIFSTLYEVQQKHGPVTLSDLVWGCIPTAADELESIYSRRHPYVARAWIDLALSYNLINKERLESVIAELQSFKQSVESKEGTDSAEAFALRYALIQLMYGADPDADATRAETVALWDALKDCQRATLTRSADGNTYCVHDAVKAPWATRCKERYDTVRELLKRHVRVNVVFYYEEDMHTTEHVSVPDARDAWAAAMEQSSLGMGGRYI